jgi:hypothetical protein
MLIGPQGDEHQEMTGSIAFAQDGTFLCERV